MTFPYYPGTKAVVYNGDCLEMMKWLPDNSIDAVVTDPPYGLSAQPDMAEVMQHWLNGDDYVHRGAGFMGKSWDSFVPGPSVWRECYRVLKPGGHLLSFAGSRTQDLMGLAIRLAGFEIRDSIAWLYGSGFPKSLDVSKAIDKAAGATREIVGPSARHVSGKPQQRTEGLNGSSTFAESVGMGAYLTAPATEAAQQWQGWGTALKPAFEPIVVGRKPFPGTVAANVLEHGTGALNIDACRVGAKGRPLIVSHAEVSVSTFGDGLNGSRHAGTTDQGRWPTNVVLDESQATELDKQTGWSKSPVTVTRGGQRHEAYGMGRQENVSAPGDEGGASRFFPVFKYQAKAPAKERPKDADGKGHATVKPLELMRWLVRLVTPPDGVVLEPFAGSGTTVEAAILEGFHCVAIERESDYLPLIFQRIQRSTPGLGQETVA